MKSAFLTDNVNENITLLGKTIPLHSQIPSLSSLLLEATPEGLFLTTTDLEFGVRIKVLAKVEEEGAVLVPGRQFIEILLSLGKEKAQIKQEKDQVILTSSSGEFKFQAIPKEEFPRLYEERGEEVGVFSNDEFTSIFQGLIFAVSQDEARPHLTGVYVGKKDNAIDYVATDGFRLSLRRVPAAKSTLKLSEGLILSPRLIHEGMSIKGASKMSLLVYKKGNQALLETDKAMLVGRLIEGTYPDYERVIPKEGKTKITIDREELLKTVRVAAVFARDNANVIHFQVKDGKLTLSATSTGLGEAQTEVVGQMIGEENSTSFNVKFVLDFLKNVTGKSVTLSLNSPVEPALFTVSGDPEFLHVIMPVRVQE